MDIEVGDDRNYGQYGAGIQTEEKQSFEKLLDDGTFVELYAHFHPLVKGNFSWFENHVFREKNRGRMLDKSICSLRFLPQVVEAMPLDSMPGRGDHLPLIVELRESIINTKEV